jgi:hypothetical protein
MSTQTIKPLMILVLTLHLPRTSKRTRRSYPANTPTNTIGPPVTEQSAPDARAVARTSRADALLGVVAVPLAGQDARGRVYARALGGRLSAAVYTGSCRAGDAVDGCAEDA